MTIRRFFYMIVTIALCVASQLSDAASTRTKNADARETATADRGPREFNTQLGLRVPDLGIAVDALYDERFNTLIPGYHVLMIVIANNSTYKLFLDAQKDDWMLQDFSGERRRAMTSISKTVMEGLDRDLQSRLVYPRVVNPGTSVNLPLFFKDSVELRDFRSISFRPDYLKKQMNFYSDGIPFSGQVE